MLLMNLESCILCLDEKEFFTIYPELLKVHK